MSDQKLPPIVLVHGLRGDHHGLADIARLLRKHHYEVYTPDLPGYNYEPPLEAQTLDEYSDWLAGYIRQNKIKKPVIIGHSMGSIVSSHFVSRNPKLCANRQVFISPIFRSKRDQKGSCRWFALINFGLHLMPPKARFHFMSSGFISLRISHFLTYDRSRRVYIDDQHLLYSGNFTNATNLIADIKLSMYEQTVFTPQKDTLICIGDHDRLVDVSYVRRRAKENGAKCVKIADTGHLVNYEDPRSVVREIRQFLES